MAELTTIARPYAKAAFRYALDKEALADWSQDLATLAGASLYGAMPGILASPSRSAQEQASILLDVCGDDLSGSVKQFVQLLADYKRLTLLPEIHRLFDDFKTQHEQAVDVELISAFDLDDSYQDKLVKALTDKLARKVKVQTQVDPTLLAGVIVKAGDLVIDGSMRGRLENLAKAINS